jgi:SPX domain protein involved in polyphosphate accumulation
MTPGRKPTKRRPEEWSCVSLRVRTKAVLRLLGKFEENFDELIYRIAVFYAENHKEDSGKPGESATITGGETHSEDMEVMA